MFLVIALLILLLWYVVGNYNPPAQHTGESDAAYAEKLDKYKSGYERNRNILIAGLGLATAAQLYFARKEMVTGGYCEQMDAGELAEKSQE